jgi:signal transduction histidine kinase
LRYATKDRVSRPTRKRALFDMFYSGREHGIGIGLALVKQIVDAHHGSIVVENNSGGGATFRVTLHAR